MYSGISGMRNFQTKLDVIGNNIANVNTYGFKKGRVTFKDMVNQTMAGAASPSDDGTRGGQNAKQVGLGSTISTIDTITTQGSLQTTGRPLDLAISGDGYFVVANEDGDNRNYTRAGNFYLDNEGYLVNNDGYYVLSTEGEQIQIDPEEYESFSISPTGQVTGITSDEGDADDLGVIGIAKFANPDGLTKVGNNLFQASNNSGEIDDLLTPGDGCGELVPGALEMSNVDLSEEFTEMIVAQRGFQANTRIITTSDEILQELVNLKR